MGSDSCELINVLKRMRNPSRSVSGFSLQVSWPGADAGDSAPGLSATGPRPLVWFSAIPTVELFSRTLGKCF